MFIVWFILIQSVVGFSLNGLRFMQTEVAGASEVLVDTKVYSNNSLIDVEKFSPRWNAMIDYTLSRGESIKTMYIEVKAPQEISSISRRRENLEPRCLVEDDGWVDTTQTILKTRATRLTHLGRYVFDLTVCKNKSTVDIECDVSVF